MYKKVIIIIVVVFLVVWLDIITNKFTEETLEILSSDLNELKESVLKKDKIESEKQMKIVKQKWYDRYKLLAFYIEHDELEKVETELVKLQADIGVKEFKHCVSELETIIFILEHIQEKEEMHFRSIF